MGLLSPTLSTKQMALLCHQLASSTEGGLTLARSLELLACGAQSRAVRRLARDWADSIARGATFSQAIHWEGRRVPDFFTAMANVGEQTGRLGTVFQHLIEYYDEVLRLYRALVRQVAYPLLVLLVMLVGIPILRAVLLVDATQSLAKTTTLILIRGLGPFVFVYLLIGLANRILRLRRMLLAVLLRIWPASRLLRGLALARFGWAMSMMLDAGLPLRPALETSARAAGMGALERDLVQPVSRLRTGHSLTEAVSICRFLLPVHRAYIEVGETSGRLPDAFARIARDQFEIAVHAMRACIVVLGPALIVLLGALIVLGGR